MNREGEYRLHIAAHIGLDLLFTSAATISAISAIAGNDAEQDQKNGKNFGCFSHLNIKDTIF